jgi:hypothetical protein
LFFPLACFHILRHKNPAALSYWANASFGEIQVLASNHNPLNFANEVFWGGKTKTMSSTEIH